MTAAHNAVLVTELAQSSLNICTFNAWEGAGHQIGQDIWSHLQFMYLILKRRGIRIWKQRYSQIQDSQSLLWCRRHRKSWACTVVLDAGDEKGRVHPIDAERTSVPLVQHKTCCACILRLPFSAIGISFFVLYDRTRPLKIRLEIA